MSSVFESVYRDLGRKGELYIRECECAGDAGGISGGDVSPGGTGPGSEIGTDGALGPSGGFEKGEGCMGKGDFHVPFPVMPCLFRYPCGGASVFRKKKKTGKGLKTVSVKNPYTKGMKVIQEGDEGVVSYAGEARKVFDQTVGGQENVYTGVLNYNGTYRVAWMLRDDGVLHMYKPMDTGSFWTVYATHLAEDGAIMLDYRAGRYPDEKSALDAVYKAAEAHRKALEECIRRIGEAVRPAVPEKDLASFAAELAGETASLDESDADGRSEAEIKSEIYDFVSNMKTKADLDEFIRNNKVQMERIAAGKEKIPSRARTVLCRIWDAICKIAKAALFVVQNIQSIAVIAAAVFVCVKLNVGPLDALEKAWEAAKVVYKAADMSLTATSKAIDGYKATQDISSDVGDAVGSVIGKTSAKATEVIGRLFGPKTKKRTYTPKAGR